jgi:hypothetical protein
MRADDDGFVSSPKKIMKMCGGQDMDYKILLAKRFLISFESGVCVIKHWKIHNYIQNDRYNETKYLDEKKQIITKENGSYTECIHSGYILDTQVRLGKDRLIGEDKSSQSNKKKMKKNKFGSYNENSHTDTFEDEVQVDPDYKPIKKEKKAPDQIQQVFDLFNNPARVTWRLRELERVAAQALFDTYGLETLKIRIDRIEAEKNNKDPLFPLVTTPSQLLDKMPNVERYFGI